MTHSIAAELVDDLLCPSHASSPITSTHEYEEVDLPSRRAGRYRRVGGACRPLVRDGREQPVSAPQRWKVCPGPVPDTEPQASG